MAPPVCPAQGNPPTANPGVACPPSPNLLACYSFDADTAAGGGNFNVLDGSQYANHGAGNALAYGADLDGNAVTLVDGAEIRVPAAASLNPTPDLTVEAWVFPNPAASARRYGVVDRNGQFGMFILPGNLPQCTGGGLGLTGAAIPAGSWTHVACSYSAGTYTQIINGVAQVSMAGGQPLAVGNADHLAVGANSPSGDSFVGKLDRIRLWNVARTPLQVCTNAP